MTTKEKLLGLLEAHRGTYFSGEEIAGELALSRAAVWKAVNALRKDGYSIDAVPNRGYALAAGTDILSAQGIRKYLGSACDALELHVLAETDSTNALVQQQAAAGAAEGYTIIANAQTAGKGRYGRPFYSPDGTGAYLSILLRPEHCPAQQSIRITTMAAAAMCRAIGEVSGETPGIKWVNDVFVRGKKICGILTEGSFSMETGMLQYAVLGVGVNVYEPGGGFPEELSEIAGSLFGAPRSDMKNRLVAAFLNHLMAFYRAQDPAAVLDAYRSYSLVVGREVTVRAPSGNRKALVLGIDENCHLDLRYDDGTEANLSCGEISVRL